MIFTFGGLVLAMLFGVFFGSPGDMDPHLHSFVFWSIIGIGVVLHAVQNLRDWMCNHCHCMQCSH